MLNCARWLRRVTRPVPLSRPLLTMGAGHVSGAKGAIPSWIDRAGLGNRKRTVHDSITKSPPSRPLLYFPSERFKRPVAQSLVLCPSKSLTALSQSPTFPGERRGNSPIAIFSGTRNNLMSSG